MWMWIAKVFYGFGERHADIQDFIIDHVSYYMGQTCVNTRVREPDPSYERLYRPIVKKIFRRLSKHIRNYPDIPTIIIIMYIIFV